MFYTTYFAKLKNLPADIIPISICLHSPKGYHGLQYWRLMPTETMLYNYKNGGNAKEYEEQYCREILSKLDPYQVLRELKQIAGTDNIALVCYEKSGDLCHRYWVIKWFQMHGIECKEYIY